MMDDLISRQAAIDIADDLRACISVDGYWAWTERLKKLPSAQSQQVTGKLNIEKGETDGLGRYDPAKAGTPG